MRRCQGKETQVSESKKKTKDFVKEETTLVREIGLGYSLLGPPLEGACDGAMLLLLENATR